MTTGEKLTRLRRENGYTQEQLAELLGVSRQSVSKWESNIAYPETEKLIKLGELYGVSMDYLLKESQTEKMSVCENEYKQYPQRRRSFEWKSEKSIKGLPLVHICFGLGKKAKGIFAIGLIAEGFFSLGLLSAGIVSLGVFSLGLLSIGSFALGFLSLGAVSLGSIAIGGIAVGIISLGGVSVGLFSIGGAAIGKYIAIGDYAKGEISLGVSKINASRWGIAPYDITDLERASKYLDSTVPWWLEWAKRIIQFFM